MESNGNGHPATPFGTPVRMILLGYYDGPTSGVLQFGDGRVFLFDMPDEEQQLSRQSFPRDYTFRPMPADSLDRLEAILAEHLTPDRPVWYVNWQFESEEAEADADARVAALLAGAGPVEWLVTVPTRWNFADLRVTRVLAPQPA